MNCSQETWFWDKPLFFQFLQNENNGFSHVSRTFHWLSHTHTHTHYIYIYIYIHYLYILSIYLFGSLICCMWDLVSWPRTELRPPGGSDCKELACNSWDLVSILGWGRSPGERNGSPLQYSCLGNPKDREAWWLQPMGSQRVGYNWANNTHTHTHAHTVR